MLGGIYSGAFTPTEGLLGNGEIAERTGLPKPTVHRMLQCLLAESLINRNPKTHNYHLGQLMYELSLHYPSISGLKAEWAWRVPVVSTLDGLPWVGAHRNFPFHFFAVALGWHGDAISGFAAKSAVRHFDGEPRKGDDAYTFLRVL